MNRIELVMQEIKQRTRIKSDLDELILRKAIARALEHQYGDGYITGLKEKAVKEAVL